MIVGPKGIPAKMENVSDLEEAHEGFCAAQAQYRSKANGSSMEIWEGKYQIRIRSKRGRICTLWARRG